MAAWPVMGNVRNLSAASRETSLIVMSLRSLLFSSDRGTAYPLGEALKGLGMEVEYCPEIFAAIEELTRKNFDLIIVDWDDEPEASFLLRTARELKPSQPAFAVVVVDGEAKVDAAYRAGANHVLTKASASDLAKNNLASVCACIMARQSWSRWQACLADRGNAASWGPRRTAPEEPAQAIPAAEFSREDGCACPNSVLQDDIIPGFAGGAAWPVDSPPMRSSPKPARASFCKIGSARGFKGSRPGAVLIVTILFVVLSLGYVGSEGFRVQTVAPFFARIEAARERISKSTGDQLQASQNGAITRELPSAVQAPADWNEWQEPRKNASALAPTQVWVALDKTRGSTAQEAANSRTEPDRLLTAPKTTAQRIPDSLKLPPEGVTVRRAVARFTPSLLGALEPVAVSEELSRSLLVQKVQPSYPEQALRAGLQGPVLLQAWIGRDGKIRDVKLISGYLVLGRAAFQAVKQWRYQPYYLNGQAMETLTYVSVNFKLKRERPQPDPGRQQVAGGIPGSASPN